MNRGASLLEATWARSSTFLDIAGPHPGWRALGASFGAVCAGHIDDPIVVLTRNGDSPRIAAHLAILNERAAHVALHVDLDRLAATVKELAEEKGVTPAQLALAWVLSRGDDVVPIPGTKRRTYLEQNAAASDVDLSDADLQRLDALGPASGDRYADMSPIGR